jgi:hypothetical protein
MLHYQNLYEKNDDDPNPLMIIYIQCKFLNLKFEFFFYFLKYYILQISINFSKHDLLSVSERDLIEITVELRVYHITDLEFHRKILIFFSS